MTQAHHDHTSKLRSTTGTGKQGRIVGTNRLVLNPSASKQGAVNEKQVLV